jgi:cytochrome c biogenesis protein CcdA/HEAT repeat protein/thioredoxin-related protein
VRRSLLAAAALVVSAAFGLGESSGPLSVTWTENLNGALTRAGNELKPVLVVFSSPDCPWCVRLKAETLSEKDVLAALEGFICVGIDTSRDERAAREYQVRGVPATLILSGGGRLQSAAEGFLDKAAFLAFLDAYRKGGGKRDAASLSLELWLKALQAKEVTAEQWPEMMAALGVKECRAPLHRALLAYAPCPRREWAELLKHPRLAVRLGTFELLEELSGSGYGYDPWHDAQANRQPLESWRGWAEGATNDAQHVFAPLTEAQIATYIRDLASGDRDRSARAVRMLEQAGESVIPVLEAWAASSAAVGEESLRRIEEVRYFLLLPESLGTERGRIAHRLVFGNQDERLRSLAAASAAGERALPVLADFLSDADPLIREAAVDSLIAASKEGACPHLRDLLKREKDEEVIHAVVRGAGSLKGTNAVELAGPFLSHGNEDLVVAALASLGRTRSSAAAAAVKTCLKSPSWRVRAAALESLGKLKSKASAVESEVIACLDDADPFVRRTAVHTLTSLSAKKAAARLKELFLKDDSLKGPVVAALREMRVGIPDTFGPALKGKDADVLLAVMDGLDDGDYDTWRLALPFVRHENSDVACAAIRVVAEGCGKNDDARGELAQVLRGGSKERVQAVFESYPPNGGRSFSDPFGSSDNEEVEELVRSTTAAGKRGGEGGAADDALADVFAAFGAGTRVAAAPAATNAAPETAKLQDLFAAFGSTAPGGAAPKDTSASAEQPQPDGNILKEALAYLDPKCDPELRFSAALMIMSMGSETGVVFVAESLGSRTAEERLRIAKRAGRCKGEPTTALVQRLLRDPSADVRREAVSLCLSDAATEALTKGLLDAAFEPGAALLPADLFADPSDWFRAVRRAPVRRKIGAAVRQVLENRAEKRYGDSLRIVALTLLEACWKEGDQAVVTGYLDSENPFVRRAAWYAFGKHQPAEFLEKAQAVARDTSEWVRAVVPGVYGRDEEASWSVYFDAETAAEGMRNFSSSSSRKRLAKPAVDVLTALTLDPALPVRSAALMVLFANREKVDLRRLTALLEESPDKRSVANLLTSALRTTSVSWLRELNVGEVLALVDAVIAQSEDDDGRLKNLRKQLVSGTADAGEARKVVLRSGELRQTPSGAAASAAAELSEAGMPQRLVVFFRNPGCRDCKRVEDLLKALRAEFADLVVEVMDIRKPDDARINEALCERFEVPDNFHLTAPAIFCGAGNLIKKEITFERLGGLLSRTEAAETEWRRVTDEEAVRADQKLGQRYSSMSPWLVFGAGLLDGVNPCAFATIIFLLSYLQLTRRGRREILAVGGAFVAGIFLAYFFLGLGLVEVVVRLSLLRRFGLLLNGSMAVFVAGVALLNVWDGVQCLRGRMGDMVLQLPKLLKTRIHDVVSHSSRHRHFVAAAFVAGLLIAVLELACTGQVYAPTLLYMLKTGQGRMGAVAYLALYNGAFIVPLLIVFAGAYGGLRSERLTMWLRQHAALVKFATALLFAALFIIFVFGSLK